MTRTRRPTNPDHATQSLNTKSTGDILRLAREKSGQTIEQVSAAINIRPSMLQAIEQGQFFGLTDPLYLKGFIRAYARYVGLNENEVLPFFRREYDEQEHQQRLTQPLAPIQPKKTRWLSPGWIIVGVLALAVVGLVGYAYQQYVSVALTPELSVSAPQDHATTTKDQITISGHTNPDATLALNGQKVQLDPSGDFSATVGLAIGSNTLVFRATNKLGRSTSIERTVISNHAIAQVTPAPTPTVLAASSSAQPTPPPASSSAKPTRLQATLQIGPSSAWIEVSVDGQMTFQGILLPGLTKSFTAQSHIHIKTGNGGSTRVILNGQDQGPLGADNQAAERDYTL